MKRTFWGLCFFILLGNQCLLAGLNDGLVAYYPFDGNANDASGNGNNGTVYGAVYKTNSSGQVSLNFNGTASTYVVVPESASLEPQDAISISFWCNGVPGQIYGTMIRKANDGQPGYFVRMLSGAVDNNIETFRLDIGLPPSGFAPFALSTGTNWQFFTATYSRTDGWIKTYANGLLVAQTAFTNVLKHSGNLFIGGATVHYQDGGFNGLINNVRIYNRALSASEIQQLYSLSDIGPAPTPPIVVQTNRTPSSTELGAQTSGNFKVFTNGNFVSGVALDPSKLTIVLTHGWKSSYDTWPSNMASQFVAAGISANLVAWDWRDDANQFLPQWALVKTPNQGLSLGKSLLQNLGAGYNQPIHFIGHSFGTCVNAAAANYLEANNYSSAKIQMTLLDEAEIGNDLRIVSPTTWNYWWIKPLPTNCAWADNYISLAGELQNDANCVNVILTEGQPGGFYISADALWNDIKAYHGVPCQWYAQTITNPAGSVMGDIWSFERNSTFTSPAGGTYFEQQGSGLVLNQISPATAEAIYTVNSTAFRTELWDYMTLEGINTAVQVVGDVTANVVETALTDSTPAYQTTPATIGISTYAPATPDYWSPQLILQNHPLNLGSNLKTLGVHPLDNPSPTSSNSPAYAWLPMTIPTNATSLSFDFMLQGDEAGDSFDVALNGTNIFSLATSLIQTNVTMNSSLIDVSSYAGQNVELFLGIVGGASTNTILTVSGIRLYSIMPPLLQAQVSENNFALSWPLSASDYVLQTSTNLADTNSWTAVPNVPAIVNLQNAVTNSASDGARFYRLKK